jgi:hypothetical protein
MGGFYKTEEPLGKIVDFVERAAALDPSQQASA